MIDRCPICLDELGTNFHPIACRCSKGRKEDTPMHKGKTQLEVYSETFDYLQFKFKHKKYDEFVLLNNRDVIMEIWATTLDATFEEFMQEVLPMANDDGKIILKTPKNLCEEVINPQEDMNAFIETVEIKQDELNNEINEFIPEPIEQIMPTPENNEPYNESKKKRGRPKK